MSVRITSKGQVAIPKWIRDRLNIKPGTSVEFKLDSDGCVVLVKAARETRVGQTAFARIRWSATVKMTTNEIMALTCGNG
jgi:antitoxin PrlF